MSVDENINDMWADDFIYAWLTYDTDLPVAVDSCGITLEQARDLHKWLGEAIVYLEKTNPT